LLYTAFLCAYSILRPDHPPRVAMVELYRTLIIGDGESLDNVGLKADEDDSILTAFAFLGTAAFNIVIMNLVIAIFTTQYGHLEGEGEMFFQRERARFACGYILQHQKLQHLAFPGPLESPLAWRVLTSVIPASFSLAAILAFVPDRPQSAIAACFIAVGQVTWQARSFYSEWFPCQAPYFGAKKQRVNHFLWVCHQADMREDTTVSSAEPRSNVAELQEKVLRIEEKIEHLAGSVDRKIDALAGDVGRILGRLEDFVSLPEIRV